jgi:hypothetical protein
MLAMTMNINDTHFDRLVDDELNEEERRELLGRLEDEPGGWRRCALAFLESQCWKQAIGRVSDDRQEICTPATTTRPLCSPWAGRLRLVSAMAASFLVALGLGSLGYQAWLGQPGTTTNSIAGNNIERAAPPIGQPDSRLAVALPNSAPASSLAANPWRLVTVSAPSGQGAAPRPLMSVPAIERDNIDEQWLRSVPPAIPDDVLRALARSGYRIQQRRELMPVPMNDGRRLVVPVDQVELHYTGNGAY